ncbi:hypothetical protein SMA5143A_8232 [Streptomyces sp. MA5143a]|nr:hypothetical protein SMA5143A_8232 [Streptomyces sp. MA5143a]
MSIPLCVLPLTPSVSWRRGHQFQPVGESLPQSSRRVEPFWLVRRLLGGRIGLDRSLLDGSPARGSPPRGRESRCSCIRLPRRTCSKFEELFGQPSVAAVLLPGSADVGHRRSVPGRVAGHGLPAWIAGTSRFQARFEKESMAALGPTAFENAVTEGSQYDSPACAVELALVASADARRSAADARVPWTPGNGGGRARGGGHCEARASAAPRPSPPTRWITACSPSSRPGRALSTMTQRP